MAHSRFIVSMKKSVSALLCALFAIALLTSAPAQSNTIIPSKSILQKNSRTAFERLGGVNPQQKDEITVILKSASRSDAEKLAAYFERFGMTTRISASYKFVHVIGTFGRMSAASGAQFERVRVGADTYVRTNRAPQFPAAINKLIAVTSINPGAKMRALNVQRQAFFAGPQTGYGPADFASIYDINPVYNAGVDGHGSTVDIAACFNISPADIGYFNTFYGLGNLFDKNVRIIHVDGTLDQSGNVPPPDIEPTLDLERVIATAPGAKVNLYLVPDCFVSQFVDMFEQIADDGHAAALSVSYGLPELDYAAGGFGDLIQAQNVALQDIANSHIATFAASGDNGAWGDPAIGLNFIDVNYPASDTNVTSVGGTTVEESILGTRLFEYAWSGSGGGYSGIFSIPPWQATTPGVASGLFKNVPDISLDADPNTGAAMAFMVNRYPIFPVGGTSVSSPTWAGIMALVNQNRRLHGHSSLGSNTARALYAIQHSRAYVDISVGANGYFPARKGYNNVTGLGVPDVAKLVRALQ